MRDCSHRSIVNRLTSWTMWIRTTMHCLSICVGVWSVGRHWIPTYCRRACYYVPLVQMHLVIGEGYADFKHMVVKSWPVHIVLNVSGVDRIVSKVCAVNIFTISFSAALIVSRYSESGTNDWSLIGIGFTAISRHFFGILSFACNPVFVVELRRFFSHRKIVCIHSVHRCRICVYLSASVMDFSLWSETYAISTTCFGLIGASCLLFWVFNSWWRYSCYSVRYRIALLDALCCLIPWIVLLLLLQGCRASIGKSRWAPSFVFRHFLLH